MEAGFDDNKEILAAIEVLNNPTQYKSILEGKK